MKPYFATTSESIKARYQVGVYPTVILFVNGQEQQRWVMVYDLDQYRSSFKDVLAAQGKSPAGRGAPAASARKPGS